VAASLRRGIRPGGVVRALGRLALLTSFAFAAGLLIGVLAEEPELLARYLRGEGVAVALAPAEAMATAKATAIEGSPPKAQTPVVDVARRAVMEARSNEESESDLPMVAAAAVGTPADAQQDRLWTIQVGAFSDEEAAARLVVGLGAKGYPTRLLPSSDGSRRWRVRVQPIRGEAKAREIAGRLKRVERLPTWVLPMEGRVR